MALENLYAWARAVRSPSFLNRNDVRPLNLRIEDAAEGAGLGAGGFARLTRAAAEPSFWSALEKAALPSDLARKDSVYFVITTRCNNGRAYPDENGGVRFRTCAHCLNGSGPNGASMTEREIEETVASLPFPLREIEISGGETLMPETLPLTLHTLRLCSERYGSNIMLSLQTNGDFLLSPRRCVETIRALQRCGLRRLVVASMDIYHGRGSSAQEQFEERLRHYARIRKNLKQIPSVVVKSGNFQELPDDPRVLSIHFFGADIQNRFDGFIIEDLAPNIRAVRAGLISERDNGVRYCSRHAGARGFLGSDGDDQIAINGGYAYPCCWFTEFPLGDVRGRSVSKTLLAYTLDPLALAMHLGEPRRAVEAIEAAYPSATVRLRALADKTTALNECSACRHFTVEYAEAMRSANPAAYERLWQDLTVPWNHRTDPEYNAVFASWT